MKLLKYSYEGELFHSTDVIEIDIEGVEIISTVSANGGNEGKEEAKRRLCN